MKIVINLEQEAETDSDMASLSECLKELIENSINRDVVVVVSKKDALIPLSSLSIADLSSLMRYPLPVPIPKIKDVMTEYAKRISLLTT